MKRYETKSIADILGNVIREEGIAIPLEEYRAAQAWPVVMGAAIARYTTEVKVRNGVLHVKVNSAPLRQNLQMMHGKIAEKINAHLNAHVLNDVRFS